MPRPPKADKEEKPNSPFSVRLFPEQRQRLKQTARRVRLSEQDCMRKAIDFGLPALEQALNQPEKLEPAVS